MKKCPDCGRLLEKIYPAIFSGPVWLACRLCRKFVEKTKEIGRVAFDDPRLLLYPIGSEEHKKILKELS